MKKAFRACCLLLFASITWQARAQEAVPTVRHQEIRVDFTRADFLIAGKARALTLPVPLQQAEPFLAVGLVRQAADGHARFSLRYSADGAGWNEWLKLLDDADTVSEHGEQASALAFLPAETRFIQISNEDAASSNVRVVFISPGATPRAMREQIQAKVMNESQQPAPKYPKPPVVTRTEWGCPDGQITTHGTLSYTTVTHLIVHHTATGNTPPTGDWPAVVRSIWNFHIFSNGWADIGYNYLIDPNGAIYEGRAGGDNVVGAHFSSVNGGTMGISMIGTFTDVTPTEKALNSLRRILAWKADQRGIDPAGKSRHAASGLDLNNISGHRDGPGATECPGDALYPLLPNLRTSVKALLGGTNALANVNAASFSGQTLASDSMVAAFGSELATTTVAATTTPLPLNLAGTTITVRDSANKEVFAPLFFVSPGQVNFLMPAGLAPGSATVLIANPAGNLAGGTVTIEPVAPGLFSADASGRGTPAAVLLRVKADGSQVYEALGQQIDLDDPAEQVFLIAYGTGFRQRRALDNVTARVSDVSVPVLFAGPVDGLAGLDQLNVSLPRSLRTFGQVDFNVTVDGKAANGLRIRIK